MTMMSESQTGSGFTSNIEDLALEELTRLDKNRAHLQGELAAVQDEIKAVKAVLKAIHPAQPKPAAKKSGKGYTRLSDELRAMMTEFLKDNEDDITAPALVAHFNWSQSTANRAISDMRQLGFLRLVGRKGQRIVYRSTV